MPSQRTSPSHRVREVDPQLDRSRWENFVARHPEGSIYQHPAWLDVLREEYGDSLLTLICEAQRQARSDLVPAVGRRICFLEHRRKPCAEPQPRAQFVDNVVPVPYQNWKSNGACSARGGAEGG